MNTTSYYLRDIQDLSTSENELPERMRLLKRIMERFCKAVTRDEAVQFSNLFSRLVFIAQKYALPKQLEWQLQHLRVTASPQAPQRPVSEEDYRQAEKAVKTLCRIVTGEIRPAQDKAFAPPEVKLTEGRLRVQILRVDTEAKQLFCKAEAFPVSEITVLYTAACEDRQVETAEDIFRAGAQLNLIDSTMDAEGCWVPRLIVFEPDYLVDASAVAECFQDYEVSPFHYLRNKFEEKENRSYLLLGNLANFFLDELFFSDDAEKVSFDEVFLRSFKQSPFEYTSCPDIASPDDFRRFMQQAREQFTNIRRVIREDFPRHGIVSQDCTLEPSFFSEKYGFQGRLDLLYLPPTATDAGIVELKSGRLPYPPSNAGKIALNHAVQTAVYRLMIQSVYGIDDRHISAAILYSSGNRAGENLRFAAVYHILEKQIIDIRNRIVANEYRIAHGDNGTVNRLMNEMLSPDANGRRLPSFFTARIERFSQTLRQCTETEVSYFYRFVRFLSKEIYLQKTGDVDYESPTGTAVLWNTDFSERAEALDVLYPLSIEGIDDVAEHMTIVFQRHEGEQSIVNFREGEICIVYPRQNDNDTVLNTQILKGSIAQITPQSVEVRFRHKQKNRSFFTRHRLWAVEHDTLDTSYMNMYKSLFAFLRAPHRKRDLLLGLEKPQALSPAAPSPEEYPENILSKAVAANDYFLLVGPPGTGKTSIFARRLIETYYADPEKNILVLAYTNRAVDELCEAINAAFGCDDGTCDTYIRVGTELSCSPPYRHRLLQRIAGESENREILRRRIESTRIYVATLASIAGRMELFSLKHFHIAIIDEASQILEPQLIGLLPRFDKFILIGDHNQLSTIVLQKPPASRIGEPELNHIGLIDCRDSFFERLLRRCQTNGWTQAYAQLTQQGRMHNDIASFPSRFFYSGTLVAAKEWQSETWQLAYDSENDLFQRSVASRRRLFFSTEAVAVTSGSDKMNEQEAAVIVRLVASLKAVYEANGRPFRGNRIGIIAPYRNQIALIKSRLAEARIPGTEDILIDTVERFQGSQRDIILLSFCVNKPYQLDFLCNLSHDGKVDRKLNVALTRAREQLFLIGNGAVLRNHPIYASLLDDLGSAFVILKK